MIEPKEIKVAGIDGAEKAYIISKLPATVGREVVAQYPVSAMPKVGDYQVNEQIMLKLMKHVAVVTDNGTELTLSTKALIDNHCADWQVLAKLEMAMLEYNTSFFGDGKVSKLLDGFAETVPALITKILTDSLEQLLATEKQHSKS